MQNFTPISAFAGGMLVGIAAAMLLVLNGRIAGISGILGDILRPPDNDRAWRVAFVAGLVAGPLACQLIAGQPLSITIDASVALLLIGGLLVGFGTSLGSGCTSGHGVCGIAQMSPRSIVATVIFMAAGGLTVYVMRHVVG